MTKQPEALRLADVLIGSPQFTGTSIWQAADMLRRQHEEITALRTALEQPAVEQEPVAEVVYVERGGVFVQWNEHPKSGMKLYTAPQAQQPTAQCKHCTKFFSVYQCNASQGECDCPKCQGFCTCSQQPRKAVKLTDEQPECSTHPDAPHGFDRNRSHSLGRYVCDCEGWMP